MAEGPVSVADVTKILDDIKDPETGRSLTQMEQVADVTVNGEQVKIGVELTTHSAPIWDDFKGDVSEQVRAALPSVKAVEVTIAKHDRAPEPLGQLGLTAKSVIAVGSGKGGVGKSTIATAIASGLHRSGCTVGIVDADVYGPSIPHLFGVTGRPHIDENKKIIPADIDGMKMISMGLLVPEGEAVVWRGPMLHGAITQFLRDTAWGNLDYLIIDMPPGTGDIALTLSQLLPLTGAVVVCTPQDVALLDAVKAIAMFRKVNIPVLGMVENMSGFDCPDCGKRYDIFGKGGAREKAEELGISLLAEVPINMSIRSHGDEGQMHGLFDDQASSAVLQQISYRLVRDLAKSTAASPAMPDLPVL